MHKRIALLINKMVNESPYKHFKCEVIPNEKSDGFWKCHLNFISRLDAHSEALIRSLHEVGLVYGETLSVVGRGDVVEVS